MDSQQPVQSAPAESFASPAIVWLAIQLAVLLLMAIRVPLWARVPGPIEQWALHFMLAAQIAASAALFPWLMRNQLAGSFTAVMSAPFIVLAGLLARRSGVEVFGCITMIGIWLAALAMWRVLLRTPSAQLAAISIACTTTIGGAVLIYLIAEFSVIEIKINALFPWVAAALVGNLLAAGISLLISRQVIHRPASTYPPSGG